MLRFSIVGTGLFTVFLLSSCSGSDEGAPNDPATGGAAAGGSTSSGGTENVGTGGGPAPFAGGSPGDGDGDGAGGTLTGTGGAPEACLPGDETEAPEIVNVNDQGSPHSGTHEVIVEHDPTLPAYTVYRPADLSDGAGYPVIAWGNGACARNGLLYSEFLAEFASHGYVVIADGEPGGEGQGQNNTDGGIHIAALDWAQAENERPCSQYYRSLDPSTAAVMGHSCGGLMAMGASGDPRVNTVMLWNSGMFAPNQSIYGALHTPLAIVNGGPDDIAYENGQSQYDDINSVPIIYANLNVGHGGTFFQDNGGPYGAFGVAWLAWHLKGDTSAAGAGVFVGDNCGLCGTDWDLQRKDLE
jgi:hypothetical protein